MNKKSVKLNKDKQRHFGGNISLLLDKMRFKIMQQLKSSEKYSLEDIKVLIAKKIRDDGIKIESLKFLDNEYDKQEVVQKIKNDSDKIKALALFEYPDTIIEVLVTIKDDDKKIQGINRLKEVGADNKSKSEVLKSIKDENKRIEATLNSIEDETYILDIAHTIEGLSSMDHTKGLSELLKSSKDNSENNIIEEVNKKLNQAELIKRIEDDNEKIKAISSFESEYLKAEIAKTINSDDKKAEIIKSLKNDWSKVIVAKEFKDDTKKIEILENLEDEHERVNLASSIKDENKITVISKLGRGDLKIKLAQTIKNDEIKIKSVSQFPLCAQKTHIIMSLQDDDKKIKFLELIEGKEMYYTKEQGELIVLRSIKDKNKMFDAISKICSSETIEKFITEYEQSDEEYKGKFKELKSKLKMVEKAKNNRNDDNKLQIIEEIDNDRLKFEIVDTIKDKDKKFEAFSSFTPEQCKKYRSSTEDIDFVKNNIKKFIKLEGFEGAISKEVLDELYEKNNSVVLNIDFKLLTPKYIELLGKDKINLISCFPNIQRQILSINDKQIQIFTKCIDNYQKDMKTEEWSKLGEALLDNISIGQYDELLQSIPNIEELTEQDITQITGIMQDSNWCEITNINQAREFEEIRKRKCDEIIKSEDSTLYKRKEALIQKIFGHSYPYAQEVIGKFSKDIEKINDEDSKDYVQCLKLIEKIENVDILNEIYDSCENCESIITSKVSIERTLKNEYGRLFNQGLYEPKAEDLLDEASNIYEAGTDFCIIMTSVGAYISNDIEDYKEDWNRPAIASQHFCASYIRNDMLGTAPIKSICYGFSQMKDDSLMLSGATDLWSSRTGFNSSTEMSEKYYSPEEQINNTQRYNEMCFRRIQDGEKKQPDYILVFKENGEIPNMDAAKKASKQWGDMPIVIVDKDKCLEAERQKVEQMIEDYKQNPSKELKKQINQKIRNNRVTNANFCSDIKAELSESIENDYEREKEVNEKQEEPKLKVSKEDLKENYGKVNAQDRKKEVSKMKSLYTKIKEAVRGEEYAK